MLLSTTSGQIKLITVRLLKGNMLLNRLTKSLHNKGSLFIELIRYGCQGRESNISTTSFFSDLNRSGSSFVSIL